MLPLLLLLALAGSAWGCDPSPLGGCSPAYRGSVLLPDSAFYHWESLTEADDYAESGEHVAVYSRLIKRRSAHGWSLVAETHCLHPLGNCYSAELGLFVDGPAVDRRDVLLLAAGTSRFATAPGEVHRIIHVVAPDATVGTVLDASEVACTGPCIRLSPSACIQFGTADFELCADAATGFMGFRYRGEWAWAVQMDTRKVLSGR